jgi:hypothetical protein
VRDSLSAAGTAPTTYNITIATLGGDQIPDSSGGRIAAAIGGDGGFIYNNDVCNTQANTGTNSFIAACGAFGGWAINITSSTFGYTAPTNGGYIFTRTYVAPESNSNVPWLARQPIIGGTSYNTMVTDMLMGTNTSSVWHAIGDITRITFNAAAGGFAAGQINMTGGTINMAGGPINMTGGPINMGASGATTGGGTLNVAAGIVNMNGGALNTNIGGQIVVNGGSINLAGGALALGGGNVSGTASIPAASNIRLTGNTANGTNNALLTITDSNFCGNGTQLWAGTCAASVQVSGSLNVLSVVNAERYFASVFVYNASYLRLKKNIQALSPLNSLDKIMQLKPVFYTLKSNQEDGLGVIAQDLEKIYPELVTKGEGMKAVNYIGLIAPLISAVQELKIENTNLQRKLDDQKAQLQKLERMISEHNSHK